MLKLSLFAAFLSLAVSQDPRTMMRFRNRPGLGLRGSRNRMRLRMMDGGRPSFGGHSMRNRLGPSSVRDLISSLRSRQGRQELHRGFGGHDIGMNLGHPPIRDIDFGRSGGRIGGIPDPPRHLGLTRVGQRIDADLPDRGASSRLANRRREPPMRIPEPTPPRIIPPSNSRTGGATGTRQASGGGGMSSIDQYIRADAAADLMGDTPFLLGNTGTGTGTGTNINQLLRADAAGVDVPEFAFFSGLTGGTQSGQTDPFLRAQAWEMVA